MTPGASPTPSARRTAGLIAALLGFLGILTGALTLAGNALAGSPSGLAAAVLALGLALAGLAAGLFARPLLFVEVVLPAISLACLACGLVLGVRLLEGRPGAPAVLMAGLLLAGISGIYGARRLARRRTATRG
jgi:hypothetical protein